MALINGNKLGKKERIKTEISAETLKKIEQYCAWANISDIGFFIEEAAHFVFSKDKDWKQQQKKLKKEAKKVS